MLPFDHPAVGGRPPSLLPHSPAPSLSRSPLIQHSPSDSVSPPVTRPLRSPVTPSPDKLVFFQRSPSPGSGPDGFPQHVLLNRGLHPSPSGSDVVIDKSPLAASPSQPPPSGSGFDAARSPSPSPQPPPVRVARSLSPSPPKNGPDSPPTCKHRGCQRKVLSQSPLCDIHGCLICGSDKPSSQLRCLNCAGGQVKVLCRRRNERGGRCNKLPTREGVSPFCTLHHCPTCGEAKNSNEPLCGACQGRCTTCGGDNFPGATLCGTCKPLPPKLLEGRGKYIAEKARRSKPIPNRYLFVWDFDETITQRHVSTKKDVDLSPEAIRANLVDAEYFKKCILHLHRLGHHVKLATWANGAPALRIVAKYLATVLGPNARRPALHDEGIEAFFPKSGVMASEGKNAHIRNLVRQINAQGPLLHPSRVVLFDDREENVKLAIEAGYGAVHCPKGFVPQSWGQFTAACGAFCLPEFLELAPGSPVRPASP